MTRPIPLHWSVDPSVDFSDLEESLCGLCSGNGCSQCGRTGLVLIEKEDADDEEA